VVTLKVDEGAAYGAALQAKWTYQKRIGEPVKISELTDLYVEVDESSKLEPDSGNAEVYRELQKLQDRLSVDLREAFKAKGSSKG